MEHFSVGQLKAMPFFQSLSEELIRLLLEKGRLTAAPKKKLLFSRQEPAGAVLLLLSGQAAVYNITKHGNRKILFFLGKGHLLNHDIQSQRTASIYCEAITDIQLLQIEKAEFLKLMEKHFSLTMTLMADFAGIPRPENGEESGLPARWTAIQTLPEESVSARTRENVCVSRFFTRYTIIKTALGTICA